MKQNPGISIGASLSRQWRCPCLALPPRHVLGKDGGKVLPKRMVVSYIAYGYTNQDQDGSHHDWNWWPCKEAGPLTFNRSAAPFAPLKDSVSYLKGLEHAGGVGMGGHSSGDVFATGADMTVTEKTNNVSVDQVAAKLNGHQTRYASLVLGTEGGTGSYGSAKTLSHYGSGASDPVDAPASGNLQPLVQALCG